METEKVDSGNLGRLTLSLEEVARALGIGSTAAYELARKNELPVPALKVGRQYRFSRRALARVLDLDERELGGDAA